MRKHVFPTPKATLEMATGNRKSCSPVKAMLAGATALLLSTQVMAAAIVNLAGETGAVKIETQNELRLSILQWSSDEDRAAIVEDFTTWREGGEGDFAASLKGRDTRGYLFTAEATGYSVKYAAQNPDGSMSLLVTPALKTKNRYMWSTPAPESGPDFTLLEVTQSGDEFRVRTSLDADISVTNGGLRLEAGDDPVFATLHDATPYYLKSEES